MRRFVEAASVAGIAAVAGCGGNGGGQSNRLAWHAGGQGGTYFPLSNEFKTIVEEYTDFQLNVQSTGASVENVGSLANGDADFALIQNDIASFARNGTGIEAFQDSPVESLRGVATLYPETITVVTLADTDITSLSDLSGATINTGDLGSGTQVNALQILEAVGISDFTEQNASFSQAADQLRNGDIDAAFVVGGWPVGAISDLATTHDITIVPIDGQAREQVKQSGSYFADDESAEIFNLELKHLLVNQKAAFNSPVWFNIGVEDLDEAAPRARRGDAAGAGARQRRNNHDLAGRT